MKIGHVFKLAQDFLWDGVSPEDSGTVYKCSQICYAIAGPLKQHLITEQEHDAVRKVIRSRLGSSVFWNTG